MAQTNLIGKTILSYTVTEKINSGVFGTVYKAVKTNPSGTYIRALKHITVPTDKQYYSILNSMGGDVAKADDYFAKMLQGIVSEIQILNDLSEKNAHNIVRYYENDIQITDRPRRYDIYILMEFLTPLEEYIRTHDYTVQDVVKLGLDVLSGLQVCHNNGVVHRDIKDDNIFIAADGSYKIGDFGVSKVLKNSSKAESMKGTPNFLAPEVYLGRGSYTKSVDLYSLGIVLYRLLNYERNPFLPQFPQQYFTEDEDAAFERRMSGEEAPLPKLGGRALGGVICKALRGAQERYQTAEEFMAALQSAAEDTPASILEQLVTLPREAEQQIPMAEAYNKTKSESFQAVTADENLLGEKPYNGEINRHLFDSIGEMPIQMPNKPIAQPAEQQEKTDLSKRERISQKVSQSAADSTDAYQGETERVVEPTPAVPQNPDEPEALDKNVLNKFVFAIPIVIFLIGIAAYFILLPALYGQGVSFVSWLLQDPQKIIDTLCDAHAVTAKINEIILIRIFVWLWLAALCISLFFVGRQLHRKPEPDAANAILVKKEAYLEIMELEEILKQMQNTVALPQMESLTIEVRKLREKLAVESAFGYGGKTVIDCENAIAQQLQYLKHMAPQIDQGDSVQNIAAMQKSVSSINSLLRRRTELKKR